MLKQFTKMLCVLALLHCTLYTFAQSELQPGYYIVVGAFAKQNNALNYVQSLQQSGTPAECGVSHSTNLNYVYLSKNNNRQQSIDLTRQAQQGQFKDAWLLYLATDSTETKTEPVVVQTSPVPAVEVVPEPEPDPVDSTEEQLILPGVVTLQNTEAFLSLYNAANNKVVEGDVEVIDIEHGRLITKVKGNDYLMLPDPGTVSGRLLLSCSAIGYRKLEHEINYKNPMGDGSNANILLMGTSLVINFDLIPYSPGDIFVLYNVFFFNDAAIMRPESKYELSNLLKLMQEDPTFKIRLHGHTNGNHAGKIISLGANKNFFALEGSTSGLGTAKELSQRRAETIKAYLVDKGIDETRIDIKSWGGKKLIYDKESVNAKKNVRVEVEVMETKKKPDLAGTH